MAYLPHFHANSMNGGNLSVLSTLTSKASRTMPDAQYVVVLI